MCDFEKESHFDHFALTFREIISSSNSKCIAKKDHQLWCYE